MKAGRITKEIHDEHITECERAMVRLRAFNRVSAHLRKKYDVTERTVVRWVAEVRKRWAAEQDPIDRTAARNEMRRTLNEAVFEAMNKTAVVRNPDGTVVLNSVTGKVEVRQQPDLQRMLYATSQLRALDGLDAPVKMKIDTNASGVLVVGTPAVTAESWHEKYGKVEQPELPPDDATKADDAAAAEAVVLGGDLPQVGEEGDEVGESTEEP